MLIRQTLAYMPAQLIGPLSQFATAIILTHWLGTAEYGLVMLVFASQELIFRVSLAWWTSYMMRYYGTFEGATAQARYQRTESAMLLFGMLFQIIGTLGVVLTTDNPHTPGFLAGACAFVVTRSLLNFFAERTRTLGMIGDYSLVQIGAPLGGLLATILALNSFGGASEWVFFAFAGVQGLIVLMMIIRFGIARHAPLLDRDILGTAWIFGLPMVLAGALNWASGNAIRFIVEAMRDAATLGLLSVAWGIASRLSSVAALVVTAAAYPLAVKAMQAGDPDGARKQISDNSALLLGMVAPASFGLIAIAEPVTRLIIAPDYQAATIELLPYALVAFAIRNVREHGWDQLYLLFEAPGAAMVLNLIEAVVLSIGAIAGLAAHGLPGAVIGTLIGVILVTIGDYFYVRQRFGLVAPLGMMMRILVATAVMMLAIRTLPTLGLQLGANWGQVSVAIFIGALAYSLAIAALFPALTRDVMLKVKSRLG